MEQIKTVKEVKGTYTKIIIPVGTVMNILEDHITKVLVKFNDRYWFLDKAQARRLKSPKVPG